MILKQQGFSAFIAIRFLITFALTGQFLAVSWQVYGLTKSAFLLGLLGLVEVVPACLMALFSGVIVDRHNRKSVLAASLSLSILGGVLLIFSEMDFLFLSSTSRLVLIFSTVFIQGIARAFTSPASFALFAEILNRDLFVKGSAVSSTVWQIAAALGPAMAGFVYAKTSAIVVYWVSVILIFVALICLKTIKRNPLHGLSKREPFRQSIAGGLKFVFKSKLILSVMSLDLFAVLFGGAVAMLPLFADRLGADAEGLGVMRAAPSVGAFFVALLLSRYPPKHRVGNLLLLSVVGFGVSMIAFALADTFFLAVVLLALSGVFDSISVVVRSAILQLNTPDAMRGRVSSVNSIFIASSNELGAFESGVAASVMGLVPSVLFGGAMTLVVVAIVALSTPQLRKLSFENSSK